MKQNPTSDLQHCTNVDTMSVPNVETRWKQRCTTLVETLIQRCFNPASTLVKAILNPVRLVMVMDLQIDE